MWWRKGRFAEDEALLVALLSGAILKAHRTLDGSKAHKLHRGEEPAQIVPERIVRRLERRRFIQSNMKFPAATYLLTAQGAEIARKRHGMKTLPLTVRTAIQY